MPKRASLILYRLLSQPDAKVTRIILREVPNSQIKTYRWKDPTTQTVYNFEAVPGLSQVIVLDSKGEPTSTRYFLDSPGVGATEFWFSDPDTATEEARKMPHKSDRPRTTLATALCVV